MPTTSAIRSRDVKGGRWSSIARCKRDTSVVNSVADTTLVQCNDAGLVPSFPFPFPFPFRCRSMYGHFAPWWQVLPFPSPRQAQNPRCSVFCTLSREGRKVNLQSALFLLFLFRKGRPHPVVAASHVQLRLAREGRYHAVM